MAGTIIGGKRAAITNKLRHGEDFYGRIGAIGGRKGTTGGFAAMVECQDSDCTYNKFYEYHLIRQCAGYKGGKISRRTKRYA